MEQDWNSLIFFFFFPELVNELDYWQINYLMPSQGFSAMFVKKNWSLQYVYTEVFFFFING